MDGLTFDQGMQLGMLAAAVVGGTMAVFGWIKRKSHELVVFSLNLGAFVLIGGANVVTLSMPAVQQADKTASSDEPEAEHDDEAGKNPSPPVILSDSREDAARGRIGAGILTDAQLNKARLNGRWVQNGDHYDWVHFGLAIEHGVPGGRWVNRSDGRWEFRAGYQE